MRSAKLLLSRRRISARRQSLLVDTGAAHGRLLFQKLIQQIGPALRQLSFNSLGFSDTSFNFPAHCENLNTLILRDDDNYVDLCGVLAACSGKLRSLDLSGKFLQSKCIAAITEHCSGLRKLSLKYATCENLIYSIWPTVGATLEELLISVEALDNEKRCFSGVHYHLCTFPFPLYSISNNCKKLSSLTIVDPFFPRTEIESLGSQLRSLRVMTPETCPTPSDLQLILDACPSLVVDAYVHESRVETLRVLQNRLRALKLNVYNSTSNDFGGALSTCTNIEELSLEYQAMRREGIHCFLKVLVSVKRPNLRYLRLNYQICGLVYQPMNEFSMYLSKVNTIEVFSCTASGVIDGDNFKEFAEACKGLRKVQLEVNRERKSSARIIAVRCTVGVVCAFSICPALKELIVKDRMLKVRSEKISAASELFFRRPVDVFIGAIRYNP